MASQQSRAEYEATFAKRLGRLSNQHRLEVLRQLGNPPDFSRLSSTLLKQIEQEMQNEQIAMLILIFIASATDVGLDDIAAQQQAQAWATEQGTLAAQRWVQGVQDSIDKLAAVAATTPIKLDQLRSELATTFGPSRIEGQVITQTTDAISSAEEFAVKSQGLEDERDLWITEGDKRVCPVCAPLHEKPREVWAAKFPSGPPAHDRCRCEIRYHHAHLMARR